jgi:hypothetical protein
MNDTSLRARLEERFGAEKIAKMTIDEYTNAMRSTIRVVQSANDFSQGAHAGQMHVAALEFPNLPQDALEDVVRARMMP